MKLALLIFKIDTPFLCCLCLSVLFKESLPSVSTVPEGSDGEATVLSREALMSCDPSVSLLASLCHDHLFCEVNNCNSNTGLTAFGVSIGPLCAERVGRWPGHGTHGVGVGVAWAPSHPRQGVSSGRVCCGPQCVTVIEPYLSVWIISFPDDRQTSLFPRHGLATCARSSIPACAPTAFGFSVLDPPSVCLLLW